MIPNTDFITTFLNIRDSDLEYFFVSTENGKTYYNVQLKRKLFSCPYCRCETIGYGHRMKTIYHPVLRDTNGYIKYNANRYLCKGCGKISMEPNPFAFSEFNSSYLLLDEVMKKLKNLGYTLEMISEELNISTTQINNYLDSYVVVPNLPLPESVGIDELHSPSLSRKNASYLCVIVDNEKRCLYDILDSRSKDYLSNFFVSKTREERHNVKYVTIDMWEPYRDVAKSFLPNAIVAVDPFHVIEHLCRDFENLRISLMKQCPYDSNGYYLLKKWNWLLNKDGIDLDNAKAYNHRFQTTLNRRDLLMMIKDTFPILGEAYELKEYYRRLNKTATYEEAVEKYDDVVRLFNNSGIPQYDEFASILVKWKTEILNSFRRPYENRKLSNAYSENINGKLRTYITVSRGLGNFKRFRCRTLFALNPKIYFAISDNLKTNKRIGRKRGPYNKD